MIIELYGLPGSGKTTLARKLAENGDFEIIKIKSRLELLFYNFLFFIKHPVKFIVLFYYLLVNFGGGWRMFYYKFMNTFLHHNAKHQKALKYKNAIIDQGYFQNIISVFERKITGEIIKKYIKFFIYPDKLIVFDIRPEKRREKIKKRGYAARDSFGREYGEQWSEIIEYNDQELKRSLNKISVNYLMFNKEDDYSLICKNIKQ
jgi:thymidylate kinase